MPVYRETRAGGAAGDDHRAVQEADKLVHCQSSGAVLDVLGRGDFTRGEGGGKEEGVGGKDGEGAEGGASSTVDGKCARAGLGKEGQMSYHDLVWGDEKL